MSIREIVIPNIYGNLVARILFDGLTRAESKALKELRNGEKCRSRKRVGNLILSGRVDEVAQRGSRERKYLERYKRNTHLTRGGKS